MNNILTEAWTKAYEIYLDEEEKRLSSDIDSLFEELKHSQEEVAQSLQILEEYYTLTQLYEAKEGDTTRASEQKAPAATVNKQEQKKQQPEDPVQLAARLVPFIANFNLTPSYTPVDITTREEISGMKFPQNLVFFVKQLVKWIKNVVLYFIAKFINIIKRLTKSGGEIPVKFPELQLSKDSSLNLGVRRAPTTGAVKPIILTPIGKDESENLSKAFAEGYILSESCLSEGLFDDIIDTSGRTEEKPNKPEQAPGGRYVVTLDFSRDLDNLKLLIQHFFDLFDDAYGSNNEKLFDTNDLEIILQMIKTHLQSLKNGRTSMEYTIGGRTAEVEGLDFARVKDNLILTNSNISNLKDAYIKTANKIRDIAAIINGKEMLALTQYGVSYKLLSEATIKAMKVLLDVIPNRLAAARKMERGLVVMQKKYKDVIKKLEGLQQSFISIGKVTFIAPNQSAATELLNSTRAMSDIITLRLSGLAVYLRELQDVRELLTTLATLNGKK